MGKLYYKQYFNIKIKSFQAFHKYLDQKFKLDFFNLHVYPWELSFVQKPFKKRYVPVKEADFPKLLNCSPP